MPTYYFLLTKNKEVSVTIKIEFQHSDNEAGTKLKISILAKCIFAERADNSDSSVTVNNCSFCSHKRVVQLFTCVFSYS